MDYTPIGIRVRFFGGTNGWSLWGKNRACCKARFVYNLGKCEKRWVSTVSSRAMKPLSAFEVKSKASFPLAGYDWEEGSC